MSKTTSFFAPRANAGVAPATGLFGRMLAAMTKARQLQADREVETYLARQSDRMLLDIGMTDADIDALRKKHGR